MQLPSTTLAQAVEALSALPGVGKHPRSKAFFNIPTKKGWVRTELGMQNYRIFTE